MCNHTTVHYIRTTPGPPVFCHARRLAPDRMRIAKAEFEAMLREGIARPTDGPWASPLHLVPKKTEGWQPCGDYRALNARTIPDRYPVHHIHDFAHCISGCHVFSVLALVKAYTQIPITADVLAEAQTTDAELQELLKGPLSPTGRYRYCLTAIDRYTRWPKAWPLEGITAEDVASAFFAGWIAHFGPPRRVTTDQGRLFESHVFRLLGLTIGFERSRTTSDHPCANGMIERFHRQFKAAIMCHPDSTWPETIPAVTLGLWATFKPNIQATPAELVYGESFRLQGEFLAAPPSTTATSDPTDFIARLRRTIAALRPSPAAHHCKTAPFGFKDLATCSHTFLRDDTVRRPLQPPHSGPYPVLRRNNKTFTLRIKGSAVRISIDRLKPAYTDSAEPGNTSAPTDVHPRPPTSPPDSVTTRSGCRVRCPEFYKP
nr:uncharacterized protein LOC126535624 [Dermacentor andersoni]